MGHHAVTRKVTRRTANVAAKSAGLRWKPIAPWWGRRTMGHVPSPTIDAGEIAELYGCAINSVYRLHLRCPGFPAPRRLGRRCIWDRAAVMGHFTKFMGWAPEVDEREAAPVPLVVDGVASPGPGHATTVRTRRHRATHGSHGPRGPRL